jgi:hypothetical protein
MAKRFKPKVVPIKSAPAIPTERGKLHKVALIQRGTYWFSKCHTCGKSCLCGGLDGDELLRQWAAWHASKVEVYVEGEQEVGKSKVEKA